MAEEQSGMAMTATAERIDPPPYRHVVLERQYSIKSHSDRYRLSVGTRRYMLPPQPSGWMDQFAKNVALRADRICISLMHTQLTVATVERMVDTAMPEIVSQAKNEAEQLYIASITLPSRIVFDPDAVVDDSIPIPNPNRSWSDGILGDFERPNVFRDLFLAGAGGGGGGHHWDDTADAMRMSLLYGHTVMRQERVFAAYFEGDFLNASTPHRSEASKRRSKELLMNCLNDDQQRQLKGHDHFDILAGNGRRYRIMAVFAYCVADIESKDRYCVSVPGVPIYDQMLACKLMLETDPATFFATANILRHHGHSAPQNNRDISSIISAAAGLVGGLIGI